MKRRILIPLDDDEIRNDEIERINRETRRLEEEAAHAERLREATAARDAAQQRLQRAVGNNNLQINEDTYLRDLGRIVGTHREPIQLTRTADEIIWEAFSEPKQEEPKVELQKVDSAKFVFHWENSSSVEEFIEAAEADEDSTEYYRGGFEYYQGLARLIRTVENIPLRELPDKRPTVKRSSRIQNFS